MSLYLQEVGLVDAPAIVFIHDYGLSSWMWTSQIETLRADYHLLIPDLPDHGQSSQSIPFSFEDTASQIAKLIQDHTHDGRAHVVAMGTGGLVSIELLRRFPAVVDHAILTGVVVHPMLSGCMANLTMKFVWLFKNHPRFIRWSLQANGIPDQYYDRFAADTIWFTRERYKHIEAVTSRFRLLAGLESVKTPTLVLFTAQEYQFLYKSVKSLVSLMPNASGRMVLKAKRYWNLQVPELFSRTVRSWIENRDLPSELRPFDEIESVVLRRSS